MAKTAKKGLFSSMTAVRLLLLLVFIVAIVVMDAITGWKMFSFSERGLNNGIYILRQCVFPVCVAWGMTFIFGSGLVDLSIGAQVALGANVGAILAVQAGWGYVGLIIAPLVVIVACELAVVLCSEVFKIPGWIAGLGCGLIFEAILAIWSASASKSLGSSVINLPKELKVLGTWPWNVIIMLVMFVIVYILQNRTTIGVELKAIGGDPAVASAVGINRRKALIVAIVIGALCVAVGSICYISYGGKVEGSTGLASLTTIFKALAIVMLAQSLNSFVSEPVGVLFAGIFIMALVDFMTKLKIEAGTLQEVVLGAIVVICGVLSRIGYKGVAK
ncbi:MAG: hypothetical protein HUJ76_05255 [Parasporobacterium sp.]|nr:hypothetical protein [Parasporobacterium sp.]